MNEPIIYETKIKINGMSCKHCVDMIESKVSKLEGVESVKVNLIENKALVRFNPDETDLGAIKSEIKSAGYSTDEESDDVGQNNAKVEEVEREEEKREEKRESSHHRASIKAKEGKNTFLQGITYGLIPHIGCIAFIIASVLGVTVATELFKPLLMNPWFFQGLIMLSLVFATISSLWYLRSNGLLSAAGAKRKWKYLSTMYGSTIGANLFIFFIIFPMLGSTASFSITGNAVGAAGADDGLSSIKLQVSIPCGGHAPLITDELKKLSGVQAVQFSSPNIFDVKFDSTKTSEADILGLDVFKTYAATALSSSAPTVKPPAAAQQVKVAVSADGDPVIGDANAPVTIIEFSDFECPFCGTFYTQTFPLIEQNYIKTGKVKLVYRDFPLSFHQYSEKAAEAAECAYEQDKFWEMHDKIFKNQGALTTDNLKQYAKDIGLNSTQFNACLDSGKTAPEIQNDLKDGESYGVSGTPTFFVNGIQVVGAQPYSAFDQLIKQALGQ